MNQKIYNLLRRTEGHTRIDIGDGYGHDVWLDWNNQPLHDLTIYDQDEDSTANLQFTIVLDKPLFDRTNGIEGWKKEAIGLRSIVEINGRSTTDK